MTVRDATPADRPRLLALNEESEQELSELDMQRLEYILSLAHRTLVVEGEGEIAAFAIAIAPGADYDSRNYLWFGERYEQFLYLDRIAVAAPHRRNGFGARIYDAMEDSAVPFRRMVCDVNVDPPNDVSLAFHKARGYRELGRLQHSKKAVMLLGKELAITPASAG
jgi:predicted GNAT superfamily acetyltransferase